MFYAYALPLTAHSKPAKTLQEWPGLGLPPQIAVDPYGSVALASATSIRVFRPPIHTFAASAAKLRIPLTPAITEIGVSGADLVDIEYDPNANLWLLNNLGAGISELRAPLSKSSVAAVNIQFGAPGSKTAGYTTLIQARFDVNATLYVYANQSSTQRSRLFKAGFPYAKPPSLVDINLAQADFVDTSEYLPTNPDPASLILGQYNGRLATPHPGSPPSPPVNVMAQFTLPLNPVVGLVPEATVDTIVGALIADPPRTRIYTLRTDNGQLAVYGLPLRNHATPLLTFPCLGGAANCDDKGEHLFLSP